jgi:hypothetical protein
MPWAAAVLNQERKSVVSIEYPFSGNRISLTRKETASTAVKRMISRFAVKLTVFPSVSSKNTCSHGIRTFFKSNRLIFLA